MKLHHCCISKSNTLKKAADNQDEQAEITPHIGSAQCSLWCGLTETFCFSESGLNTHCCTISTNLPLEYMNSVEININITDKSKLEYINFKTNRKVVTQLKDWHLQQIKWKKTLNVCFLVMEVGNTQWGVTIHNFIRAEQS